MQLKANFKTETCIPIAYIYMTLYSKKASLHVKNRLLVQYMVYAVALSSHKNNIDSTSYENSELLVI